MATPATQDIFNKINFNLPINVEALVGGGGATLGNTVGGGGATLGNTVSNTVINTVSSAVNTVGNTVGELVYQKFTKLHVLLMVLGIILVFAIVHRITETKFEAFTQEEKYVNKKGAEIYDEFYCSIYDDLFYSDALHAFHCAQVDDLIPTKFKAVMLDIGSGTGHFVDHFCSKKIKITGIDSSPHMIALAKKEFPKCKFKRTNALSSITFDHNYFTHITCLYFTIYYNKNKTLFFQNCFTWLKPNGLLVLHLVNREMFDPIIPAGDPLVMISAQKYAKDRIMKTAVKFKDFSYKAKFSLNGETDIATLTEDFKDDKTGNKRQNEHVLYMEEQKEIIYLALSAGFKLEKIIDMVTCQYEYQFLYVLRKT
jgi:2-polyprenyl-3-methyl-5-hydroxy-6-metoxy-1,4-benzoquinol methylase